LALIVNHWPDLPDRVREKIVVMVREAAGDGII
jgi:hypothetical protein